MVIRLTHTELQKLVAAPVEAITDHDRDEMAIPSYLHANPLIRWLMWRRYEEIARLAHFDNSMSVLEFGCGIGLFLPTLAAQCAQVSAIDIFPQYARLLVQSRNLPVRFFEEITDVDDSSLDCIIAADVLEHLQNPDYYLDQFRRKLKQGGRLLVSGPTENIAYRIGRCLAGFGDKGDYHQTNIDHLIPIILKAGFDLSKITPLPFRIPPTLFRVCLFTRSLHHC